MYSPLQILSASLLGTGGERCPDWFGHKGKQVCHTYNAYNKYAHSLMFLTEIFSEYGCKVAIPSLLRQLIFLLSLPVITFGIV